MNKTLLALAGALLTGAASGQSLIHYWDFSSMDDQVGGLLGTALGTPDLSVNSTYGEAYPGAGASLNTVMEALGAGNGGAIDVDVYNGSPTALDFGTDDYSVSYWVYDDSSDGDVRGPRIFDFLDSTSTGMQLVGDATGSLICRVDDDAGVAAILTPPGFPIADQWIHIAINVDRTNSELLFYVDGAPLAPIPLQSSGGTTVSGNVYPTQDLRLGVVNFGVSPGEAQNQGMDDLAFYDGLLSAQNAADLASGDSPLSIGGLGTNYCTSTINSTGLASVLSATGSASISADDLILSAANLPSQPGIFIAGPTPDQIPFFNGFLCISPSGLQRFAAVNSPTGGTVSEAVVISTSAPGGLNVVAGQHYYFQRWNRDPAGGGGNANFSDGLDILYTP